MRLKSLSAINSARNWIMRALEDPITKILLENSHLTKTQLETLLIDILSEGAMEKKIGYGEKVKLRLRDKEISRGAFTRTLKQSRKNVIRTIYTIILLGYLGFLESPRMDAFTEVSNRLRTYTDAYRVVWERIRDGKASEEDRRAIELLQIQLQEQLESLAKPKSLTK